jgi:hypothetical protein
MPAKQGKLIVAVVTLIIITIWISPSTKDLSTSLQPDVTATPELTVAQPSSLAIPNGPLKQSILSAGDYIVRQQLANGELSYQVDFQSGARQYSSSTIRLMSGTGSLYTVCNVSGEAKYCEAGDLALKRYLDLLVTEPEKFTGTCLYTNGICELGGSALTIDAIYKRWRVSGDLTLDNYNLKHIAVELKIHRIDAQAGGRVLSCL